LEKVRQICSLFDSSGGSAVKAELIKHDFASKRAAIPSDTKT
jgi:hypothetical protein